MEYVQKLYWLHNDNNNNTNRNNTRKHIKDNNNRQTRKATSIKLTENPTKSITTISNQTPLTTLTLAPSKELTNGSIANDDIIFIWWK